MIQVSVDVTTVFEKTEKAIHATNPDGSRKYRYIIHEGSSRSSKTRSIIQATHKYANQNKNKRISVWRDTLKDCKDTVGDDIKRVYPDLPLANFITFNKTESYYTFPSGSVLEIRGADDPNKLHGYNCDVAWTNEPYLITKDVFDQIDMRTSDFIIIDWNPQEYHWIDDLKNDPRAIVIHSTFRDNPFCPPEQKTKILSYQPVEMCDAVLSKTLSRDEAIGYIENKKNIPDKMLTELVRCQENERKKSASKYNWSVYGLGLHAEKPNRIFSWEEISEDVFRSLSVNNYYGSDWGVVDPWGIVDVKYYDGALYVHELNYASENDIRYSIDTETLMKINQDQEGGLVKWKFNQLNIDKKKYIICDNNRTLKILALHEAGFEYAMAALKVPGSIIDGINILTEIPVYYTSSSINIRAEQMNYSRKVDRYGVVLEEPEDKFNHLMDAIRYVVLFLVSIGVIRK